MSSQQKIRIQWFTILIGFVLMSGKFIAYYLTDSNIILTDALESIVNIATGIFGLYSLYLAAKPKDEDHPYGHGKIEFISAGLEGGLITIAGISIIVKSISSLLYPQALHHLDIGLLIVAAAGIINYSVGYFAEKVGKNSHSMTLIASGKHLKIDAYSTVGMLLGLALIALTGWFWLDSLIAIIIGFIIVFSGVKIVRASVGGIMDETDFALIDEMVVLLEENRQDNWIDVHNLRVIKYGDSIHIDCHVTLPWYYTVDEGHAEIEKIEALIDKKFPNNLESFIHIDPCVKTSCSLCRLKNCDKRREPFQDSMKWTRENVMMNKKHGRN
jgi:cation diffusion facilitator family transporter